MAIVWNVATLRLASHVSYCHLYFFVSGVARTVVWMGRSSGIGGVLAACVFRVCADSHGVLV